MTGVFTTFFRDQLYASLDKTEPLDPNANLMAGKSVHWVYFRNSAAFSDANDSRYIGIKTVSELLGKPGWSPPITPQSATQTVGCTTTAENTYVVANNLFAMGTNWATTTVSAAVLVLEGSHGGTTDPIIYLTDTPFEGGVVMSQEDALIARPVPALAGNRSLFSWPVWFTGQTLVQPVEGSMAVLEASPGFEAAYTQHAWLYPQRVNMIANPSFETNPGTNHWRSGGTLTHVGSTPSIPSSPGGGAWYGRFAGTAPIVAESNIFPLTHRGTERDLWTIQMMVRGTGRIRVGLLGWEPDFLTTYADWGDKGDVEEIWDIPASGWLHVYALRRSAENTWGMVRIECDGGEMHLDNVLCEADWLKDWRYFDGDSTYGSREDYSWYGGENLKGTTYSCWYNHRRAVIGRLFAWDIQENDFTVTDEEVQSQGFVYRWVPAGVRVAAHYDVLWPDDIQEPVPNNAGTAVTPYAAGTNGGVPNPWAPFQYLDVAAGTVSTSDTADMQITGPFRLTVCLRLDSVVTTDTYISLIQKADGVYPPGSGGFAGREYLVFCHGLSQSWSFSSSGADGGLIYETAGGHLVSALTGSPHTFAYDVTPGTATGAFTLDGQRTSIPYNIPVTPFNTAGVVQIGSGVGQGIVGRTYWAQMEKLDAQGNVTSLVWRFDATEYPGSGTVYTDPRGRVWTLTSAAAIGRAV